MPVTQFDLSSPGWKHAFLFLVLYWVSVSSWGQGILPTELFLDQRSTANGLTYNEVTCFYQDKRGFTWIGTEYGLSRFDGRKFKNYQHQKGNPNSLTHNRIVAVSQLADGRMAIGTEQGFCFLSPDDERFEAFLPNNQEQKSGLKGAYYCRIFQDSKKRIWVCSLDGLYLFDPAKKRVNACHNPVPHPIAGTQPGNRIYAMAEDRKGNLWVGTGDGLFLFEPQKNEWRRAFDPSQGPDYLKFGALIGDIAIHPNGALFFTWFEMGLHRLEHLGEPPLRVDSALPGNQVVFGSWQGKSVCWYKAGAALRVAHADSLHFEEVKNLKSEDNKAASVSTVYPDPENRLWLGFSGRGFGWLDARKQSNHLFTNEINSGSFSTISSVLEEKDRIWVANYHGNDVSVWDTKTGRPLWHQASLQKLTETHTSVGHILSMPGKNYWFSTLCGLFHYAETENRLEHFQPEAANPVELFRQRRFIKTLPAGNKALWVLTYGHKLCYFDLKTSTFNFLRKENDTPWQLAISRVEDMATDANGTLWMVGDGQLLSRKPGENQFTVRFQKTGLSLQTLAFAPDGSLWISTNDGLLQGDAQATSFQKRSLRTICPVETIESMVVDSKNRLWFSHLKGITVFDPMQGKSRQFNPAHGLPQDHMGGIQAGNDEKLWYFGEKLLGWIDTKNLEFETAAPPIHLTSVSHLGKSLFWSSESGKASLSLPHYMNDIEIGFSVINYNNPMETRYFYRIEEHDSVWKEVNDGKISFSNLAPGTYRICISGSGGNAPTGQAGFILIVVNPPFWETGWFRIGALAFAALGIYFYLNQRIKKIRTEAAAKAAIEKEVAELQVRALRTQMNPHFLFNSFNAIQECVVMGKTQEAVLYLAKFAKLVRLILEHSDKALIPLNQEIEVLKNYLEVEGLRFSENLDSNIEVHTHLDSSLLQIPPMLVQPFVENAIWHGLLKKEGAKKLTIRFASTEEYLFVVVEDNGIGRKKASENQSGTAHRSMAMNIIEDRFKRMGDKDRFEINIDDLADHTGKATGTRITLKLAIFG